MRGTPIAPAPRCGLLAAFDPRYRVKVRSRVRDVLGMKEVAA